MQLTFLGTGTSIGVPVIGCDCANCTSGDPRDRRTRHGALLALEGGNLLIDTPPELRLQLLAAGVRRIGAVWYTHLHADHVHGIDDVRVFSTRNRGPVPAHLPAELLGQMSPASRTSSTRSFAHPKGPRDLRSCCTATRSVCRWRCWGPKSRRFGCRTVRSTPSGSG